MKVDTAARPEDARVGAPSTLRSRQFPIPEDGSQFAPSPGFFFFKSEGHVIFFKRERHFLLPAVVAFATLIFVHLALSGASQGDLVAQNAKLQTLNLKGAEL